MPCSCITKNKNKIRTTDNEVKQVIVPVPKQYIVKEQTQVQEQSSSLIPKKQNFDFNATVLPQQLCIYCAIKHLSFVAILLQQNTLQDKCIAAGQLLCVRAHLKDTFKGSFIYLTQLAISVLLGENIQDILKQLILQLQDKKQNFSFVQTYLKEKQQVQKYFFKYNDLKNTLSPFLYVYYAYALLFTEPSYEEINKSYAIGALNKAAYQLNKLNVQTYYDQVQAIREIWKLIEAEQDYKKSYNLAQAHLNLFINNTYVDIVSPALENYKKYIDSIKKEE